KWSEQPILVLAFVGTECPVSRSYEGRLSEIAARYAPRDVAIAGIDANPGDSPAAIAKLIQELQIPYPLLRDFNQTVANRFAVARVPEVIVLDRTRILRYRGRVDDQFSPGSRKGKPTRADLEIALDELLAGKPVTVPMTQPAGCPLERSA